MRTELNELQFENQNQNRRIDISEQKLSMARDLNQSLSNIIQGYENIIRLVNIKHITNNL